MVWYALGNCPLHFFATATATSNEDSNELIKSKINSGADADGNFIVVNDASLIRSVSRPSFHCFCENNTIFRLKRHFLSIHRLHGEVHVRVRAEHMSLLNDPMRSEQPYDVPQYV